jgi:hypothetical protein
MKVVIFVFLAKIIMYMYAYVNVLEVRMIEVFAFDVINIVSIFYDDY